jgi:hypothetical protein
VPSSLFCKRQKNSALPYTEIRVECQMRARGWGLLPWRLLTLSAAPFFRRRRTRLKRGSNNFAAPARPGSPKKRSRGELSLHMVASPHPPRPGNRYPLVFRFSPQTADLGSALVSKSRIASGVRLVSARSFSPIFGKVSRASNPFESFICRLGEGDGAKRPCRDLAAASGLLRGLREAERRCCPSGTGQRRNLDEKMGT